MTSVADLVDTTALETLATPANLRLGREIAAEDGVALLEFTPLRVRAVVGSVPSSPTRRTVELTSVDGALKWSCTCTRHVDNFCKHCVATALVTVQKAPGRRKP